MRLKRGIHLCELANTLPDRAKLRERRLIAVVKRGIRLRAEALQLVGATQHASRGFELIVFSGAQLRVVKLADLEFEQIDARCFFALVHLKRVEFRLQPLPLAKCRAHLRAQPGESCKLVQDTEMALRIEQRLMLMLAMELHQR